MLEANCILNLYVHMDATLSSFCLGHYIWNSSIYCALAHLEESDLWYFVKDITLAPQYVIFCMEGHLGECI
jgi:hypothetical protein